MLVRTFKEYVALSMLGLMMLRDRGYTLPDIVKRSGGGEFPERTGSNHDRPAAKAAYTLLHLGQFSQARNFDGLIAEFGEQVMSHPHFNSEGAVIDAVIQILQLPYARNRITSDALKSLRRVLLLPDEDSKLRDTLSRKEAICVHCRRKLEPNELVTFSYSEANEAVLYCIRCVRPENIPCTGCGEPAPIGARLKSVIKAVCPTCQAKAQGKAVPSGDIKPGILTRIQEEVLATERVQVRGTGLRIRPPAPTFTNVPEEGNANAYDDR